MRWGGCITVIASLFTLQVKAGAQEMASQSTTTFTTAPASATRAMEAPLLDGRDGDAAWQAAEPIRDFQVFAPTEGGTPRFQTEAKVVYDDRALFVFVRAFDPEPDRVVKLMSRRDVKTASDQIVVLVDSFRDRRSGYIFAVNPAGVKRDYAISDDLWEDISWDGVWEVSTRVDSLGWTAEFRIPFSQIRYTNTGNGVFGFGIRRDIARIQERVSWPLHRMSQPGIASQLGELRGVLPKGEGRHVELVPYVVMKNISTTTGGRFGRSHRVTGGVDLKYSPSPNMTLDATINPDFGQVEADPALVNLTAFEQFLPERRPFFMEKTGNLQFPLLCEEICYGLLYTRRIGRAPQLLPMYGTASSPAATTILGALRFTGRSGQGFSWGVLNAVTDRERGTQTIEPRTNYFALRAQQDVRNGESGIGLMLTSVQRALDDATSPYLHRQAYTGGVDFRHRFLNRQYQVTGYVAGSHVAGSPDAIALTQQTGLHYFQSPDSRTPYDNTRTSLRGTAQSLSFAKVGGALQFSSQYQRTSPGFEINDLGFTTLGNHQFWDNSIRRLFLTPTLFYRSASVSVASTQSYTSYGQRTNLGVSADAAVEFVNGSYLSVRYVVGRLGSTVCAFCTRGGPFVRNERETRGTLYFEGNPRLRVFPKATLTFRRADLGRSRSITLNTSADVRITSQLLSSLGLQLTRNIDALQWVGNFGVPGDDSTHYTFGRLDQPVVGVFTRIDYTLSPAFSIQFYGEPFVTSGRYNNWIEVADPHANSWNDRYCSFVGTPGLAIRDFNFNYKQFRSNLVFRWEYQPASTMFLVWTQGRTQDGVNSGSLVVDRDYRNLFRERPDNTFLFKISYWLNP